MPRRTRFDLADVPQHIIQRGNSRNTTFFTEDDYRFYADRLHDAARKYDCSIYAYVLMPNHVHLLASARRSYGLSLMMQYVGRYFVRHINRLYRRSGTLWEGRFRASPVDADTYFLRCCRYIECNPVRAGIVRAPENYPWSSYPCHAYGAPDQLVTTHEQYDRLGRTPERRQQAYLELFRSELGVDDLAEIRNTVNGGWPLGSNRFKDEIESRLNCEVRPPKRGRPAGNRFAGLEKSP